jgi:hypothetical protein
MPNTQTLKVTVNKLIILDNGEAPGKGELRWSILTDDRIITEGSRKSGDGETINLGNSATVTKGANAVLTVLGNVTEEDGFLKGADDTVSFKNVYTQANNFGRGSHIVRLDDGKHLKVELHYSVS